MDPISQSVNSHENSRIEARVRLLADLMPQIIWTADHNRTLQYCNKHWYDYSGMDFELTRRLGCQAIMHPDDERASYDRRQKAFDSGQPYESEYRLKRSSDGMYRWHLGRTIPVRDDSGHIIQWLGICTDIHEKKIHQAEVERSRDQLESLVRQRTAQLTREHRFLEAVLENTTDGIVACDENGTLKLFNRAAREFHGMREQQLPPEKWAQHYSLFRPDGVTPLPTSEVPLLRAFNGEVVRDAEMVIAPDGGHPAHRLIASGRAFYDDDGKKLGAVAGMRDVTEKIAAEDRFRILFDRSSVPHFLLQDGRTLDCNAAAVNLLGCSSKTELLKMLPGDFSPEFQPDGRPSAPTRRQIDQEVLRSGHCRFEWVLRKKDGPEIFVEASLTAIELHGKPAIIAVCHDLTERRLNERALAQAKETAETATRAKSEFLANMSHEIRTPVTAILGYTQLLVDPRLSSETRAQHAQVVLRNAQHLLALLNDILDMSKIEAGKMAVERISFDPALVLKEIDTLMSVPASDKNLAFSILCSTPLPPLITSDPTRLKQILINLVNNAIKFTAFGSVQIVVTAENLNRRIRFDVIDTGIGLTAEQQSRLFLPFSQADASMNRRFGGSGLGLVICKRLAGMLGGELSVTSERGKGSTFTLVLDTGCAEPIPPTRAPRTPTRLWPSAPLPTLACRILIAEDTADTCRLVTAYLQDAGATVHSVSNGRLAVEAVLNAAAHHQPFDLVLMDMQMPELDGYGAAARLRQLGFDRLPIIAFTAHAMLQERQRCLAAGCTDYIAKPIDRAELLHVLHRNVNAHAPTSTTPVPASITSTKQTDHLMGPMLKDYIDGLPPHVTAIIEFLEAANLAAAKYRIHQLRGSGGSYGFAELSRLAAEAEDAIDDQLSITEISRRVQTLLQFARSIDGYDPHRETSPSPTAKA